ncbi:gap junction delta-3 protein-like [Brachionichthys hirsutus]|uniref:gap junction delta-3 protein-like n=1 Tax=Brachionichthys hirsutus TaxID=412623 RepID=UPI003605047C
MGGGGWGILGGLFDSLQAQSFLGTVASDLFGDEQEEFACDTLQPGCKQVHYNMAFPISQHRFWVFHVVFIATSSLVFLTYSMRHHHKWTNHPFWFYLLLPGLVTNPKISEDTFQVLSAAKMIFKMRQGAKIKSTRSQKLTTVRKDVHLGKHRIRHW